MEQPDLIRRIRTGDALAFEQLFKLFYSDLCRYALSLVQDAAQAEELVQDMFVALWSGRAKLEIHTGIRPYLYRAVHNRALKYLDHLKVREQHRKTVEYQPMRAVPADAQTQLNELKLRYRQALADLPEECRKIFVLSREHEFSYREIADYLGISIKTVENQMGKALRVLRNRLGEYLPLILSLIQMGFFFFLTEIGGGTSLPV